MAVSPAKSAADILVAASVGSYTAVVGGWMIRVGKLVDDSDQAIAMYDSPGEAPDPKWLLDYPRFQMIVRGKPGDYGTAYQKAKDAKDVLLGMNAQNINGDRFDGILGVGDICFLKYDDNDRPLFSMNFRAYLEPGTSALTNRQPL